MYLIDNSIDDIEGYFQTKILSLTNCTICNRGGISARGQVVIPIRLEKDSVPNVSVQSYLLESSFVKDRFHDFSCDCEPEDAHLTHRMFYLQLPVALLIMVERGNGVDNTVLHCPVKINETLFLSNMLPGQYNKDACVYRLAAVLVHHGKSSTFGHYNCAIFNDLGEGLKFDDSKQVPVSLEKYINGRECKENCRMLVYINSVALRNATPTTNTPWESEMSHVDNKNVERILFGFENSPNEVNLPVESYRTIACNENLHGDVISTFLQHLAFKFFGKSDIEVLPSQVLTAILEKRSTGHILSIKFYRGIPTNSWGNYCLFSISPNEKRLTRALEHYCFVPRKKAGCTL